MSPVDTKAKNSWLGTKKGANQVENESQNANFFTNTDVLTSQSILVRESIQNAIDARDRENGCNMAFVRFYVGSVTAAVGKKYFAEQYERIVKCLKNVPNLDDECLFIAVEDFNTTGLVGSVNNDLPEGDSKIGSYFYFTWATGKSNKKTGTRGKNGVGKIVFPKTSRIKSFLVFSSRDNSKVPDEGANLLFGTSILRTHELGGSKWLPESHWMHEDASIHVDSSASETMHIPSSNVDSINEFAKDWKLKRKLDEYGTSIVIPYRDENFTGTNLAQCVTQDYFVAILEGILEVEVIDETGFKILLNSENITENLENLDTEAMPKTSKTKDELLALCRLFKERQAGTTLIVPSKGTSADRNYWGEHSFDESMRDSLRDELDSGKALEFKINTYVPALSDGTPVAGDSFSVLVKKIEGMYLPSTFVREGIIIPSANRSKIDGYSTLVVIDSGRLADLLGDAEGPSHERWSSEEEKFQGKFVPKIAGEETIKFVRESVIALLRKIQVQVNEVEDSRYANAFPLPTSHGARPIEGQDTARLDGVKKRLKKKNPTPLPKPPKPPKNPVFISENFEIIKSSDGFTLIPSLVSTLKIGDKFEVKAGYDLSTGNPLAKSAVDFELVNRLALMNTNGVTVVSAEANYLTLTVGKVLFRCVFEGFDTYRDLIVAVNDVN